MPKKIYSKEKRLLIKSKNELKTPIEKICHIYKIQNIWSDFIKNVIYEKKYELIKNSVENNLLNIINEISSNNQKSQLLKSLMKINNYNPYEDKLPIEFIDDNNIKNLTMKKQKFILNYFNYFKKTEITLYENKYKTLIIYRNELLNTKKFFDKGFDIIILFNSHSIVFLSNPILNIDFYKLYDYLEKIIPNKWYLHGSNNILKNKNGTTISLEIFKHLNINIDIEGR